MHLLYARHCVWATRRVYLLVLVPQWIAQHVVHSRQLVNEKMILISISLIFLGNLNPRGKTVPLLGS